MTITFQSAVGARIRALRERSGLSQRDFAAAAGMNAAFAGRVERGLQNLTLVAIARVALALKVPVEAIFAGIEPGRDVLEAKPRRNSRPPAAAAAPITIVPTVSRPRRRRPPAAAGTTPGKPGTDPDG